MTKKIETDYGILCGEQKALRSCVSISLSGHMCECQSKVHISAFVRYDFVGFMKPKRISTIGMFVGFFGLHFHHTYSPCLSASAYIYVWSVSSCVCMLGLNLIQRT